MNRGNVVLKNPERFEDGFRISKDKLKKALDLATAKLKAGADEYKDGYPSNYVPELRYTLGPNDNWIHGMLTGCYLLAYEATGDKSYLDVAKYQLKSYEKRLDENINLNDHDGGFVFSPSCIAYYKITGDEYAKELGLRGAKLLYDVCYTEEGGFILRIGDCKGKTEPELLPCCRTMMDTMMNAPLFFWMGQETGEEKYTKAALSQCDITNKYLIREDASSNHHYQFELGTYKPMHGVTLQGNRDDSTWSRGHSWGIAGYPIAYNYEQEDYMLPLHRDVTYFYLNNVPDDLIAYWDFDFISGDEPRDSSAAAISACGMLEAARVMPYSDEEKEIFITAAHKIANSLIDMFTTETGEEYDGLMTGVTPMRKAPQYGLETCSVYGDYFFLELLVRLSDPDWKRFW